MSFRTIEQKITAGNDFDGTAPTGPAVLADGVESYPAQAAGGLFAFGGDGPIEIRQVFGTLADQTAWALTVVDADATETIVDSGTTETFFAKLDWGLILVKGQTLKLETTGASTAMKASVTYKTHA